MNIDVNKRCFEWVGNGFEIGETIEKGRGFDFVSMEDAYFKYLDEPFWRSNDQIIQVDKNHKIIRMFSIQEAKRILKLSEI